ncbi:uncharacterized protein K441DRAFT_624957 [Cenococcum geophilum 1.58]|uniref:uncharacterized protein n=1 Tax=Cenococcum geophilum 1.58 TaxID=794803 RepID=UPI00358F6C11|nr:hypothetical protein K441DRAFT_624957 [Cenococcum geophilum 1.58]
MSERRRTSARTAKAEPVKETTLKRKRSAISNKEATPIVQTPVEGLEPVQEPLPVKLIDGQPLPTLPDPQPSDLSAHEFQSLIQSGVLGASLKRSRETWLSGCHFKKYYTKPTTVKKLKDRTAEDKEAMARDKALLKAMIRIGEGNLTIDPHIFTITLYTVKEPPLPASAQRHMHQYSATPGTSFSPYQPVHQTSTPKAPMSQQSRPNQPTPQSHTGTPSTPVAGQPARTTPTPAAQAAPDPVIHMLAQRAGTDVELKAVMKIVAAGQATAQQLEFFQGHINELTKILEAQKAAQAAKPKLPPPPPPPKSAPAKLNLPAPAATPTGPSPTPQPPQTPYSHYNVPGQPHSSPYPPLGPPQKPALRPIYFEFHEGNGDRLHFPEHSILEYLPGGRQVRASFLVTKSKQQPPSTTTNPIPPTPATPKSAPDATTITTTTSTITSTITSTTTPTPAKLTAPPEPKPELYQPVTALVSAGDPRVLEWLARAVHPPEEVEKYMDAVFDTAAPAEEAFLALRLPREGEDGAPVAVDVEMGGTGASGMSLGETPLARRVVIGRRRG